MTNIVSFTTRNTRQNQGRSDDSFYSDYAPGGVDQSAGKQFVALTDELVYDHPELISGPIVPYTPGMACHHWLSIELNPDDDIPVETDSSSESSKTPIVIAL